MFKRETEKKFLKLGKMIFVFTIPYFIGVLFEYLDEWDIVYLCNNLKDVIINQKLYLKPSMIVWITLFIAALICILISKIIRWTLSKNDINPKFVNLMANYSEEIIRSANKGDTYSWGYDYCLFYSKDNNGWNTKTFKVTEYIENEYEFPCKEILPGYSLSAYNEYLKTKDKVTVINNKNENRDRYSVQHFKINTSKKDVLFDIKLVKTKWIPLQFSWDYFRTFDSKICSKIKNKNEEIIKNEFENIMQKQGSDFFINSLCLHLVIGTNDGLVLSKIGNTKENDYPMTWAATIGEQIELEDFYNLGKEETMKFKDNFVNVWVKRAIFEELGVDIEDEYKDLFDKSSLRVLSVDIEGDIYNVAITCSIDIKGNFDKFKTNTISGLDRCENYLLKEITYEEIRKILLNYPNNNKEYHPSTYLRILMYHFYKKGVQNTKKLLLKENNLYK